jgi:hypothetical protein
MPLQTAGLVETDYTQADLTPDPSVVRGAVVEQAFSDLVGPSILRGSELSTARRFGGMAYGNLTPDAARAWVAGQGLESDLAIEDRQYNPLELSILARRKTEELRRQAILARAPSGAGAQLGRFGLTLATSLADPLTIASAFVPVVGEAKYAQLLARAGQSAVARAGVRAGVGAVEGGVGAALVEPLILAAKTQEQADYGLADSLLNIGLGTVFGGGLHAVGGAVGDRLRAPRVVETINERLAAEETRAAAPAPDAPRIDPAQYTAARETGGPDEYFRQATMLREALARVPDVDPNDPRSLSKALGTKAVPLSHFIRDTGGIVDDGGELSARDVGAKDLPGLVRKAGTSDAGMDSVRQRVWEAGYFPDRADYNDISDSDLFDAITEDVQGNRRYPQDVQERLREIGADQEFAEAMRRDGITKAMSAEDIARHLRDLDDSAKAYSEAGGVDPQSLAEYDTAAELAARAGPEVREAALRTAVSQAVTGRPVDVDAILRRQLPDVERLSRPDPDAAPLADVEALRRVDETLAAGETADEAAVKQQIADLDAEVRALEAEAKVDEVDDVFPAEIREELDAAAAAADEAALTDRAGRMLAACALRFGT